MSTSPTLHSSTSTTTPRSERRASQDTSRVTSTRKVQEFSSQSYLFFQADLDGKKRMLPQISKAHLFEILNNEKGASLIKAATLQHPFYFECLEKMDEEQIEKLCSSQDSQGKLISVALIEAGKEPFLDFLLCRFKTEKVVENFFLLNRLAPLPTSQTQNEKNLFFYLQRERASKLSALTRTLFIHLSTKKIKEALIHPRNFTHLSEKQKLSHFATILDRVPPSEKKILVLFFLLKIEAENSQNEQVARGQTSLFVPLIKYTMSCFTPTEKSRLFQRHLFDLFYLLDSSSEGPYIMGGLLDLVIYPRDPESIHFLTMTDSSGTTFLEKILTGSDPTSKDTPSAQLLNFRGIDPDELKKLLLLPSKSLLLWHFLEAIANGKIDPETLNSHLSEISGEVMRFFNANPEKYPRWITALYHSSVKNCAIIYQILKKERLSSKWNCQFMPELQCLPNEIALHLAIQLSQPDLVEQFPFGFANDFSLQQKQYIQQEIEIRVIAFKKITILNKPSPDEIRRLSQALYLYRILICDNQIFSDVIRCPVFKKLLEDESVNKWYVCKYLLVPLLQAPLSAIAYDAESLLAIQFISFSSQEQKEFLLLCPLDKLDHFFTIKSLIFLLFQKGHFEELTQNPSHNPIALYLINALPSAQETYWEIESHLLHALSTSNDLPIIACDNAWLFFQYLLEQYPYEELVNFFPAGTASTSHFQAMIDIAHTKRNAPLFNERFELISKLIFSRFNFLEPETVVKVLQQTMSSNRIFFSELFSLSNTSYENMASLIHQLSNIIGEKYVKTFILVTLKERAQSPETFDEQTLMTFFLFLSQQTHKKRLWLVEIFIGEGVQRYSRTDCFPFSFYPETQVKTQVANTWLMLNFLRSTVDLPPLDLPGQMQPMPDEVFKKNLWDMTIKALKFLRHSRETDQLSLGEKFALAYPIFFIYRNSKISFTEFSKLLLRKAAEENRLPCFLSIVELHLVFNILNFKHLPLENYPRLLTTTLPTQDHINLNKLLDLFKQFTFEKENSPTYLDLSEMYREDCVVRQRQGQVVLSRKNFKKYLDTKLFEFIRIYIPNCIPITGLSADLAARKLEYQALKRDLKIITAFLLKQNQYTSLPAEHGAQARLNMTAFLPVIASMTEACATRWQGELAQLLEVISKAPTQLFELMPLLQECTFAKEPLVDLEENYQRHCRTIAKNQSTVSKRSYYEQLNSRMHHLVFQLIPFRSMKGLSQDKKHCEEEYTRIEQALQMITSYLLQQKELATVTGSIGEHAKNQLQKIVSKFIELEFDHGLEFLANLERLVQEIQDTREENLGLREEAPSSKKGKLLTAIQRAYNHRIHAMPYASDTHWKQLFKKLIWTQFPLLMENPQTVQEVDSFEPKKPLSNGEAGRYTFADVEFPFFTHQSFFDLEKALVKELNSELVTDLKKQYGSAAIVDILVLEVKKSLNFWNAELNFKLPANQINELATTFLPIFYDEDLNLNEAALICLLRHHELQD